MVLIARAVVIPYAELAKLNKLGDIVESGFVQCGLGLVIKVETPNFQRLCDPVVFVLAGFMRAGSNWYFNSLHLGILYSRLLHSMLAY